jgi:hypothetical protein
MTTFVMVKTATDIIENIVVADSIDYPNFILGDKGYSFFELSQESGPAHIGLKAKNGRCQPFASWSWDEAKNEWICPAPKPDDETAWWDEESLEWKTLEKKPEVTE